MQVFLIAIVAAAVAVAAGVSVMPMSMAADMAASRFPDFKFQSASGSVWDGKLQQVAYGSQFIGDLDVRTDLLPLLGGKATGKLGLSREGFTGTSDLSFGLGGDGLELRNLKLVGNTALVPGMPVALARADGRFTLEASDVKFVDNLCQSASGEVWTDVLSKVAIRGWVGPELRGPVTCDGGQMQAQAGGKAASGEDVLAILTIGQHLDMKLTATVANASPAAVRALTDMGFVPEGNRLVLKHGIGGG